MRMPRSVLMPLPCRKPMSGRTPMATTTSSVSRRRPLDVRTSSTSPPVPWSSTISCPRSTSMPACERACRMSSDEVSSKTGAQRRGSRSNKTTGLPRCRMPSARIKPSTPPPTTTTGRFVSLIRRISPRASSQVRIVVTPATPSPGQLTVRGKEPGARSSASYETRSPPSNSTHRSDGCSFVTTARSRTTMRCS